MLSASGTTPFLIARTTAVEIMPCMGAAAAVAAVGRKLSLKAGYRVAISFKAWAWRVWPRELWQ